MSYLAPLTLPTGIGAQNLPSGPIPPPKIRHSGTCERDPASLWIQVGARVGCHCLCGGGEPERHSRCLQLEPSPRPYHFPSSGKTPFTGFPQLPHHPSPLCPAL